MQILKIAETPKHLKQLLEIFKEAAKILGVTPGATRYSFAQNIQGWLESIPSEKREVKTPGTYKYG